LNYYQLVTYTPRTDEYTRGQFTVKTQTY